MPASTRANQARLASIFGLVGSAVGLSAIVQVLPRALAGLWPVGFLSGVAGLVLALVEQSAIARGTSPVTGRKVVRVALGVSAGHLLVLILFFGSIFATGFLQGFRRP